MIDLLESWLRRGPRRAWQLASGDGIAVVPTLELWEGLTRRIYPLTGPVDYESQARVAIEGFTPGGLDDARTD